MIDYTEGAGVQYHIGLRSDQVGKYVLLPGDPKRSAVIASYLDDAKLEADNREFTTYTGTLLGEKVSVTSTGIGGSSAAIAIEELVRCGAHTFIRVGTSGGMQPDILGGDLAIATGAIRMEGTSKEYAPIEYPAVPDFTVTSYLQKAAASLGVNYHMGVVECKDSFYGQHEPEKSPVGYELLNKWDAWIKCGAIASEMESAAIFTVGSYLRVRVASVLLVIANQERARLGLSNPQVHDLDFAIKTAVLAIKNMIEDTKKSSSQDEI